MANTSSASRAAAYLFLVVFFGALVAYGGYKLYNKYGPSKTVVDDVPFGLESGTSVLNGDAPNFKADVERLPVQAQAEFRRAGELSRSGAVKAAYEIYDALVLLYPNVDAAVWGEVNTLFSMDSVTETMRDRADLLIGRLMARYPNTGISFYLDSRKSLLAGNLTVALELAKMASTRAPSIYEIRLWYAELLLKNSNTKEAALECRAAISLSSGDSQRAFELLAKVYHDAGSLDSSSLVVEYALTQFPLSSELMLLRGNLAEYNGKFDVAEKTYQRILAFRPDFEKARRAMATIGEKVPPGKDGYAGSARDRAQVACDILSPLVERYPENLPLREALGIAYLKNHMFDLSRREFNYILKNDPEYPDIKLRLSEVEQARRVVIEEFNNGLTANLNRAVDSLRGSMEPEQKHDFSTKLGHYLVRYGASSQEFFKKYSLSNFKQVKRFVWQESFYEAPYHHTYTIVFDNSNRFKEVHVTVYDSSSTSNHLGVAPEIFSRLMKQNSRISGIGNNTGETVCGDGVVMDAVVWETRDNFEILARIVGKPAEVRMVRLDRSTLPPTGMKLCDYLPLLLEF
ncbi:MAG: tetratricopeptide repeat protein [Fibrobacter sp.]|nr:tetratricopeptide repeat protein [Fibrobacter sp.]MBQ5464518.1 tetratricopeptide repeat protein [Fibrobacter sp.]